MSSVERQFPYHQHQIWAALHNPNVWWNPPVAPFKLIEGHRYRIPTPPIPGTLYAGLSEFYVAHVASQESVTAQYTLARHSRGPVRFAYTFALRVHDTGTLLTATIDGLDSDSPDERILLHGLKAIRQLQLRSLSQILSEADHKHKVQHNQQEDGWILCILPASRNAI